MFNRKRTIAAVAIAAGAAIALAGCAGGGSTAAPDATPTFDPDEKVTLDLAFWGNDVRAELYNEAIAAFNEEYPNITVNATFLGFPEFWEKRQTEAAGGNLPDVMQFDYSYLRQYSENNLLLPTWTRTSATSSRRTRSRRTSSTSGSSDDVTTGIPTSTNAWGLFTNPVLLETAGVDEFEGGDWEDYTDWLGDITAGAGGAFYGGTDFSGRIQNFELQLRSEGSYLFSEDGEPGFDEERLTEFWESGADIRDGIGIPQQRLEEVLPQGRVRHRAHCGRAHVGQLRCRLPGRTSARATPSSAWSLLRSRRKVRRICT